jgi:signal transduction histidine kinase
MVAAERDQLLHEKMSVLRNMMIADRIVSLGLLAAGLSHQIRNSMVAVKTFLELAPVKMEEEKGSTADGLRDPGFWKRIPPQRPVADRKNQRPARRPAHRVGK